MAAAIRPAIFVTLFHKATDGLRRLDRGSGLPHRPATAIADDMAPTPEDSWSRALWRAHVARAMRAARALKAGWPAPRLMARDPYALRALVLILAVATFFGAGGERIRRITAAFDWTGAVAPANYRVDAWVTPPNYTGRPPLILPGIRAGEPIPAAQPLSVPAGSILVIRATGTARLDVVATGGLTDAGREGAPPPPSGTEERRFAIRDGGTITLRGIGDEDVTWNFSAVPDRVPTIALTKDPEAQGRGGLLLQYKVEDDYGVTEGRATFARKAAADGKAPHPLFGAPEFPLVMPQARTRSGVGQTTKDLTDHPWAGVDVIMTLIARDEAGNEGRTAPFEFTLPQRVFVKPLAKSLVELRRMLALDAETRGKVVQALDALTVAPEKFIPESGIYLGLRSIFWQLTNAKTDDDLREVVGRLWAMAVQIEDGNVSDAGSRCAPPRRRCARRWKRAQARKRSRSSPISCARRSTGSCRRWPRRCARIRSSSPGRSIPMRARSGRRISRTCSTGSRTCPSPAPRMRPSACSRSCSRSSRTCRWRGRVRTWTATTATT